MFKIFENEEYINLNYRSLKMQDVSKLIKYINEMFEKGYIIDESFDPKQCPKIPIVYNLKFIKNNSFKPEVDNKNIDSLSKKEELIAYAKAYDIEIPEDITHPMSIKKYIKENLEG